MSPYMTIFRHLLATLDPDSPFFSKTANQITKEFVNVNQHNLKFNSGVSFILKTLIFATFTKIMFFRKIIWRHTPFAKHKIIEAKNFHNYCFPLSKYLCYSWQNGSANDFGFCPTFTKIFSKINQKLWIGTFFIFSWKL